MCVRASSAQRSCDNHVRDTSHMIVMCIINTLSQVQLIPNWWYLGSHNCRYIVHGRGQSLEKKRDIKKALYLTFPVSW